MTSQVIKNSFHINSKLAELMDPMELLSLNELLDHIAALGVATDYDRIGLKPDQWENNSPPVTHHIAVVEEKCSDLASTFWTNYVRIPELSEPDTRLREDMAQAPNLESGNGPQILGNIAEASCQARELLCPWVSDRIKFWT